MKILFRVLIHVIVRPENVINGADFSQYRMKINQSLSLKSLFFFFIAFGKLSLSKQYNALFILSSFHHNIMTREDLIT